MTVQAGLCRTWSEPKLLVFSRTGSIVYFFNCVGMALTDDEVCEEIVLPGWKYRPRYTANQVRAV